MTTRLRLAAVPTDLKRGVAMLSRIKEKVPNIWAHYSRVCILLKAAGDSPTSAPLTDVPCMLLAIAKMRADAACL
jgi:hypothetical protein